MNTSRVLALIASAWILQIGADAQKDAHLRPTLLQHPFPGFVPDERTACSIAEAIARPMFGDAEASEFVFSAKLKGNVWKVTSKLRPSKFDDTTPQPTFMIAKDNARIIEAITPPG